MDKHLSICLNLLRVNISPWPVQKQRCKRNPRNIPEQIPDVRERARQRGEGFTAQLCRPTLCISRRGQPDHTQSRRQSVDEPPPRSVMETLSLCLRGCQTSPVLYIPAKVALVKLSVRHGTFLPRDPAFVVGSHCCVQSLGNPRPPHF